MSTAEIVVFILGMPLITLLTRGFFILPERDWSLPAWLDDALRFAPLGALVAVSVPDVLLINGQWPASWHNARWCGAAAATAWFFWRRSLIGTIVAGASVMLALRLALGW